MSISKRKSYLKENQRKALVVQPNAPLRPTPENVHFWQQAQKSKICEISNMITIYYTKTFITGNIDIQQYN